MTRFESYRSELAKDLQETRHDDREAAQRILEEEKGTTRYKETESVHAEERKETQEDFIENKGLGRDFALATHAQQEGYDAAASAYEADPDVAAYLEGERHIASTNATLGRIEANLAIAEAEYQQAKQAAHGAREQARLAHSTYEYATGSGQHADMVQGDMAGAMQAAEQAELKYARVKELKESIERVKAVRDPHVAFQEPHAEEYAAAQEIKDAAEAELRQAQAAFRQHKVDEAWKMQEDVSDRDTMQERSDYLYRLTGKRLGADIIHYGTIQDAVNGKIDEGIRAYQRAQQQKEQGMNAGLDAEPAGQA